jgi:hypothetical protein
MLAPTPISCLGLGGTFDMASLQASSLAFALDTFTG